MITEAKEELFRHNKKGSLGHAKEFTRLGMAYAEIQNETDRERYHNLALHNMQMIRACFSSLVSPSDLLRLTLDDIWPTGASLLNVAGKKFL